MYDVDLEGPGLKIICHPSQEQVSKKIFKAFMNLGLKDHFIVFSSGTTGKAFKGYALSRSSLLANARAVNDHFKLTQSDVWGLALPTYHVGGLSVLMRARLSQSKIVDCRQWDAHAWVRKIEPVTVTTIVPTQLYDLVKNKLRPSRDLRLLIVGGDALNPDLNKRALDLGWPVVRTFGMTEVGSQLASAAGPGQDELRILPIHKVKTDEEERLYIKSPSLFSYMFKLEDKVTIVAASDLCDEDGFYKTQDRAKVTGDRVIPKGRMDEEHKIAGHLVNLADAREGLASFLLNLGLFGQMELVLKDDERKGKKLCLAYLPGVLSADVKSGLLAALLPIKIDEFVEVETFNRTSLGKLKSQ